jgi:hypothetical protein
MTEELEALAALEHDQWMAWAKTLLSSEPGISAERRKRWQSLMVPYKDLPEDQKEHDRKWARKALVVLASTPRGRVNPDGSAKTVTV